MRNLAVVSLVLVLAYSSAPRASEFNGAEGQTSDGGSPTASEQVKQSVFLFCPHKQGAGAWSLYVLADKKNPSKILALGLEELAGKNSKDHTYNGVLDAQKDPATQRNEIARLDARDFATGRLEVKENNLLSIKVDAAPEGLKLTIDARVSLDGHFIVGGSEQDHRNLILKYSSIYKCWQTKALKLENSDGQNAVGKYSMTLTGIVFTAGTTMVSRICAVDEFGSPVVLMER